MNSKLCVPFNTGFIICSFTLCNCHISSNFLGIGIKSILGYNQTHDCANCIVHLFVFRCSGRSVRCINLHNRIVDSGTLGDVILSIRIQSFSLSLIGLNLFQVCRLLLNLCIRCFFRRGLFYNLRSRCVFLCRILFTGSLIDRSLFLGFLLVRGHLCGSLFPRFFLIRGLLYRSLFLRFFLIGGLFCGSLFLRFFLIGSLFCGSLFLRFFLIRRLLCRNSYFRLLCIRGLGGRLDLLRLFRIRGIHLGWFLSV